MRISICIATWSRREKLIKVVESLENQTVSQDEYEIIIVDSHSPDGTDRAVKKMQEKYSNIVYIGDSENILACKRNVGIQAAKAEIVVFMDDDVIASKQFIESHLKANERPTNTFYCGQIRFPTQLVLRSNYYYFRDQQHLKAGDEERNLPFNNIVVMNLSFRKELIDKTGYVNEAYLGYGDEDIDFGYRVIQAGCKIRYLPDAIAIHEEPSNDIRSYENKLYKCGLYGDRILKRECPEAYKILNSKKKIIGYILSVEPIRRWIEKYLVSTDADKKKYNYVLYKCYLIACTYKGRRDQKKIPELTYESLKHGW